MEQNNESMKNLYRTIFSRVGLGLLALVLCFTVFVGTGNVAEAAIDFNGSQSAKYDLSNGEKVRIEYHSGQPHYHDSRGSANLSDGKVHHSKGKLPKSSTRDIMDGKKGKSQGDKNARKKAKEWKEEWKKSQDNAKKASKNFIQKNKRAISNAAECGKVVIVIGGIVYVLWWLFKIASGWGILIPV